MQIKSADDRTPDLAALDSLLARTDVGGPIRTRIEAEVRSIRAGAKGERDAEYQIEFHLRDSRNVMTIHDLRLELDGRVAQIDHVIMNRLQQIWVCESKSFSEGVAVNEHGEWSAFYGGRARGIPSPIEQNRRHIAVLSDVIERHVELPKRLGIKLKPTIHSAVLVSSSARITRPKGSAAGRVDGLDTVVKVDQFVASIQRAIDERLKSTGAMLAALATAVSSETVERQARQLADLHRPISVDWAARFGLPPESEAQVDAAPKPEDSSGLGRQRGEVPSSRTTCDACGGPVTAAVVAYCRANATRFGNKILCFGCQRKVRRTRA